MRRLLGDLAGFRRDPLGFFTERARAGDVVPVRLVTRGFLVNHPDDAKHVLQDNHTNYGKGPLIGAMTVQRYRLQLVPGHRLELDASITLRPRHGITMTLQRTDVAALQSSDMR